MGKAQVALPLCVHCTRPIPPRIRVRNGRTALHGSTKECQSCQRSRYRVGLTDCCGSLWMWDAPSRPRYCSRCPGKDRSRVMVVLVHPTTGAEMVSYHPVRKRIACSGQGVHVQSIPTLAQHALNNDMYPDEFVFTSANERDWGLGKLSVSRESLVEDCRLCGAPTLRSKWHACRLCDANSTALRTGPPVAMCSLSTQGRE